MQQKLFFDPVARRLALLLTRALYRRLPRTAVPFDDLHAAALEGLWMASRTFDPQRGLKFSTYARHRIRGAMFDCLRALDALKRGQRSRGEQPPLSLNADASAGRESRGCTLADPASVPDRAAEIAAEWVEIAARGLTAPERTLLRRRYVDGVSNQQIAREFGWHDTTVWMVHARALRHMRYALELHGLASCAAEERR